MSKPSLHEDWIDPFAMRIVQILQNSGFETYLVGGCVRDLLVGIHPKDFDIATNALPNEVKRKVPHAYVIGKRFRLVLVKRGDQQFEVATFRRNVRPEELEDEDNPIVGDNYFGTSEEDSRRRDFTVNALFYDPIKHKLIDFVDGQKDIESRTIKMIGDAKERCLEDPIRILRAIRLAHKLDFRLDPELRAAMIETRESLLKTALPRRREEYLKILRLKEPGRAFSELFDLGLLELTLPRLHRLYSDRDKSLRFESLLREFSRVGLKLAEPVELLSGFLWSLLKAEYEDEVPSSESLENDPDWIRFLKDELGVFKLESAIFHKCLELQGPLHRIEAHLKKGRRRQIGFLRNESLGLALALSQLDRDLDTHQFHFWLTQIAQNRHEIARGEG